MTQPLVTRPFVTLWIFDLVYFTAGGVLLATTPFFARERLLATEVGVGIALGAFSVSTILIRPWLGRWSDRHGRRVPIIVGAAGFAVIALGHLMVTSLAGLVLVRLALGAAEALVFVAGVAALVDLAPPGRMGEALSVNSLALYAGLALGPVVGQALMASGGFTTAWLVASGLCAVGAALALTLPETRPALDETLAPAPLIHRAALLPGLVLFTGVAVSVGFLSFAGLYADHVLGFRAWSSGLFAYAATVVLLRVAFRKLPDRLPPALLAAGSLLVVAGALVVVGLVRNPAGLLLGAVVLGAGVAFLTPAIFALVFARALPAERGSASATVTIFIDLAFSGGPFLVGLLSGRSDIPTAFLAIAVVPWRGWRR